PAIGVGSAFEGWSPCEGDAVYRMFVPLKPPRGHTFHLELGTVGEMPVKDSHIRVELECTCAGEGLVEDMLCFLHHPEEELRRKQDPSPKQPMHLLHTLCTGSYLDVEKTVLWFQNFVKSAWMMGSYFRRYNMKVLPSRNSCKLQLMNAFWRILITEIIFGVQQGNSDIFLCSQTTETIFTPRTTWPETYVVAEAKFFSHVARQAPRDSFHLKCLQLCAHILVGTSFSTYFLKTIVMHLLTSIPVSDWRRRDFLMRLLDIMQYLRYCLEEKRLDHFFFGNENMPEEITLPPAFQTATPPNLFQHLEEDPVAHTNALREYNDLQDRLIRLLFYGY
ncbi:LOW QUALITY PROTEIN: inositol 1,4,5-trisphosphate receptor-interacting protein-like 1, partial [Antrostomus carolinensis]|uniref:LOW QUALITY PROTEIN: inositol 1,4,5-trisphosphate receptor-interacting protein-like 1 n=1 Tax=Antrostomus carolinensis TaxID=279965 RepID=UPI0010A9865B